VLESKAARKHSAPSAAAAHEKFPCRPLGRRPAVKNILPHATIFGSIITGNAIGFIYHRALARSHFRVNHEGERMEAYRIERFGSVDGIVLRSSDDPRPGLKEILMRVRASSLNYRDLMVLKGGGRGPTKLGMVPLSDGAGEVAAVGDGVTRVKLGERVIGTFHPRWFGGPLSADYLTDRLGANLDGMLAEYAVLSEEALVPAPRKPPPCHAPR
jgi:Alcohol dehydrogenase GroES-like domain